MTIVKANCLGGESGIAVTMAEQLSPDGTEAEDDHETGSGTAAENG